MSVLKLTANDSLSFRTVPSWTKVKEVTLILKMVAELLFLLFLL